MTDSNNFSSYPNKADQADGYDPNAQQAGKATNQGPDSQANQGTAGSAPTQRITPNQYGQYAGGYNPGQGYGQTAPAQSGQTRQFGQIQPSGQAQPNPTQPIQQTQRMSYAQPSPISSPIPSPVYGQTSQGQQQSQYRQNPSSQQSPQYGQYSQYGPGQYFGSQYPGASYSGTSYSAGSQYGQQPQYGQSAANGYAAQAGTGNSTAQNPFVNPASGTSTTVLAGKSASRSKGHGVRNALISGLVALLVSLLVLGIGWAGIRNTVSNTTTSTVTPNSSTGGSGSTDTIISGSTNWKTVAKKVAASVVSITITSSGREIMGSGVIIDKKGDIITNNHVASNSGDMTVTLSNGDMYKASIVGSDSTTDIAVVRIKNPPKNLTYATFANSDNLAVGESVMAIGNPLGYENTATTGVVSALNRPVTLSENSTNSYSSGSDDNTVYTNTVQIDAAINSGNSGGPSFNASGKIIGINTAIASTASSSSSGNAGSIGIGFAIPANTVKWVADEIIKSGKVEHVTLGVTVQTGTATVGSATRAGATVKSVSDDSSASAAGLQTGDTIVAYNGNTVGSVESLLGYVRSTQKNSSVTVTVIRDGKYVTVKAQMTHAESKSSSSNSGSDDNNNNNNDDNNNDDGE